MILVRIPFNSVNDKILIFFIMYFLKIILFIYILEPHL